MTREELEIIINEAEREDETLDFEAFSAGMKARAPDAWATEHFCVMCDRRARFGHGVSIGVGRTGEWRCLEHRLEGRRMPIDSRPFVARAIVVDPVADADKLVRVIGLAALNEVFDAVALSLDREREAKAAGPKIIGWLEDDRARHPGA